MGIVWSVVGQLWPSSEPATDDRLPGDDEVDAATGLTVRQKRIIAKNWDLVRPNLKEAGVGLFIAYLTKHPEMQARFKSFATVPLNELAANRKLQAHAANIMYSMTMLVDSLNDVECLVQHLATIGRNHRRRHLKRHHFQDLAVVIVDFLEAALAAHWSAEARQSWTLALNVIVDQICNVLEEP